MLLLETMAQYGADQAGQALAPEVTHHAKRAVLDWLSALYPGSQTSPANELMRAHADELGLGKSRLPGRATTTVSGTAAWINGSASHSVEFDDIFRDAVYHPGCPVISAALAVADARAPVSGEDFLKSIVIGYEISTRIGAAIQPSHYKYFHTTGTVGALGAAAAAAALCAAGKAGPMQHAIATSATFASGLQQAFRSDAMSKALHAGHAAAVGVWAGQGAAAGITGVVDILEGPVGFGAALSENPNWDIATRGLGQDYNIVQMTQKNHGCCGHTFAAIDAALALKAQHGFSASDIREIRVESYQVALNVTGNPNPTTAFEGKFSLPYVVSHALVFGSVRLDAFEPDRLHHPEVRKLIQKLTLTEDPVLTAAFPGQRAARVTIVLNDGTTHEYFQPARKGDPEMPLSDADLDDKFRELVGPVLGSEATETLREQIWNLDRLSVPELALDGRTA